MAVEIKKLDFIGVGGARSGTKWMTLCLYEHPQVCMPAGEINFFSKEKKWSQGLGWYEKFWQKCPFGKKAGEISASYWSDEKTPERLFNYRPNVKIIVSLRHPVDRIESQYANDIMAGVISSKASFTEASKKGFDYIERSRHATNLKRYLKFFARGQILVLIYEEIFQNPAAAFEKICRFLEINPNFKPSFLFKKVNERKAPKLLWLERLFFRSAAILRRSSLLRWLWWLLKKSGISGFLRELNIRKGIRHKLTDEERKKLADVLAGEVKELEELLGRKVDAWKFK